MIDFIHRYVLSASRFHMQKRYPKRCFSIPERIPEIIKYREHPISRVTFSPDSWSYWGSYFKYRKRCLCALEPKRWCCCRVLLPDVWLCALWSLGAGAAARCHCQMCGRVRVGAWALVSLLWCCLLCWRHSLGKDNSKLAALRGRRSIIQGSPIQRTRYIYHE